MLLRPLISRSRSIFIADQCPSQSRIIPKISTNVTQASSISHSTKETPQNVALRLMPLGGSITYGVGSSHGNGYRKYLQDLLLANGYTVRMVGSRKAGSMHNNRNEGWRGYRLDQIATKARRSVATVKPNIFTINVGSNDCIQNHSLETFWQRMDNLLEYLWETAPQSTIILSTLLTNADLQLNYKVLDVNRDLIKLFESKAAEQKRIVLANMFSASGPHLDELVDGTHPNNEGYKKMAQIWFEAIQKASANGFFEN
ncbi:hypothetical protein FGADI_9037 [Fusarium gaditjirri]|uniref:SGNH hydrolase-type esterase domain-containing protein n=1 Tax=Fusarium gaditjirri TaxID=282569 RepID=A0A8H4T0Z5_9HYPO|nr:hypothetical protein FGADI_9037 [Fusarium gaditjirri]